MTGKRPFIVGLTGSIGMGKSTTAAMFEEEGAGIWDADAAVRRLYAKDGAGVAAIKKLRPDAVVDQEVDKSRLKAWIADDKTALAQIERAVHPLVAMDRAKFLNATDADIVVLDIPLLFETGQQQDMDMVCVVSAPAEIQRDRVLMRPGMTEKQFDMINQKQMPDAEKRKLADFVISTENLDVAKVGVNEVMQFIRGKAANA